LLVVCRAAVSMSRLAQFQSSTPKCIPTKLPMCALVFKSSQCPHGKLTFCSLFAGRWCLCQWWHSVNRELRDLIVQNQWQCARSSSKVPNALMGNSPFARCLQGGGVYVNGGTVSIVNSEIYLNAAQNVRARVRNSPSPRLAVAYVRQRPKVSQCPHGRLMFCLLFAGRRCLCLFWHGHDNVFLDPREYSLAGA